MRLSVLNVMDVLLLLSFIDLNLKIVNGLPPRPMRVCLNSSGPGMVSLMMMAVMSSMGVKRSNAMKADMMVSVRFMVLQR